MFLQLVPPASTKQSLQMQDALSVRYTATPSETGRPSVTATLDTIALTLTLLLWPVPVRKMHKHRYMQGRQCISESTDSMCVQTKPKKSILIVSPSLYLYQTERDTNLSQCHPCFVMPLLMTKPPSTSCLRAITKDIEE